MKISANIQHLLLDIEGTTCPVNFVSDVLFPYAKSHMLSYLQLHQSEPLIQSLMFEIENAWQQDSSPDALALANAIPERGQPTEAIKQINGTHEEPRQTPGPATLSPEAACLYLQWLIQQDRKLTPLKDLQGMIWEEGYQQGHLLAPLYDDVPAALKKWHQRGLSLSVYSSGSIQAQKLLYTYSNAGNLSHFFSSWFDTRTGPKNERSSYVLIAEALQTKPETILFISDSPCELKAAQDAEVNCIFSRRPGNPVMQAEGFPALESFDDLQNPVTA